MSNTVRTDKYKSDESCLHKRDFARHCAVFSQVWRITSTSTPNRFPAFADTMCEHALEQIRHASVRLIVRPIYSRPTTAAPHTFCRPGGICPIAPWRTVRGQFRRTPPWNRRGALSDPGGDSGHESPITHQGPRWNSAGSSGCRNADSGELVRHPEDPRKTSVDAEIRSCESVSNMVLSWLRLRSGDGHR